MNLYSGVLKPLNRDWQESTAILIDNDDGLVEIKCINKIKPSYLMYEMQWNGETSLSGVWSVRYNNSRQSSETMVLLKGCIGDHCAEE